MAKILITGAGGFIGGHLVAEALERGHEVWAAVRATTSREFLTDERINFIVLDFTDEASLEKTISEHLTAHSPWDYVVHNLGLTKATNYLDFERVNYGYMRLLVDTLRDLGTLPRVFLLMSSLSVMGAGDEDGYSPFDEQSIPMPNTRYGVSKLKAETYLQQVEGMPYTIFRCTGVYGPHERDYFLMIKSIKRGVDFGVGFKKQLLTFIYVKDLARAVMDALERGPLRRAYYISEPRSYTQAEFRTLVCRLLGKRWVLPVKCPLWVVKAVCAIGERWARWTGKAVTLNSDKYNILAQRNWQCDITPARRDFGFDPRYDLEAGLREAIAWYRSAGWL